MRLRQRQCNEPERIMVAMFTGQEVMSAMYKAYPERFKDLPDQFTIWFRFAEGGMIVERVVE